MQERPSGLVHVQAPKSVCGIHTEADEAYRSVFIDGLPIGVDVPFFALCGKANLLESDMVADGVQRLDAAGTAFFTAKDLTEIVPRGA